MRRFDALGVAVCMALVLAAVSAGSAWAGTLLELNDEGVPAADGAPAWAGLVVNKCITFDQGKLTKNGKASDKAGFTSSVLNECAAGYALSGSVTEVKMTNRGVASAKSKAKLFLSQPGPCVYEVSKFSYEFPIPGGVIGTGTMKVKLDKPASNVGCTKIAEMAFEAGVTSELAGAPFETELRA